MFKLFNYREGVRSQTSVGTYREMQVKLRGIAGKLNIQKENFSEVEKQLGSDNHFSKCLLRLTQVAFQETIYTE